MNLAPIALFVYKRLEHTNKTVESLKSNLLAIESDLFIFSDQEKNPNDRDAVQSVREYVRGVTGFRSVHIIDRPINFGLAKSIIDGVSLLCGEFGRVIVVEDDLVTSPNFLEYMNGALDRYADDDRVMQISAHMFPVETGQTIDAMFLPITTSWGWATWRRAWDQFDADSTGYELLKNDKQSIYRFNCAESYDYFNMLERQMRGEIDSWAIRWYLSVFLCNGLVLFPKISLIENIGFDGTGTHGKAVGFVSGAPAHFRVVNFPEVKVDFATMDLVCRYLKDLHQDSLKMRFSRWLRRLLCRLNGLF